MSIFRMFYSGLCYHKNMETEYFIEDCFTLAPGDVLRNLSRVRLIGTSVDDRRADVNYYFDNEADPDFLLISVGGRKPQAVAWEWSQITFGERAYFRCGCGCRVSKLFLPPNGSEFRCRGCHKLRYRLATISRKSVVGQTLYRLNRLEKLAGRRAELARVIYNGKLTGKFESFLKHCNRAGLDSIVRGARDLMALTQTQ